MSTMPQILLIIGYGNSLRRDDGAGMVLAGSLFDLWQAEGHAVRLLLSHQLTPEMALDLAAEDVAGALFVDASIVQRTSVALLRVDEEQAASESSREVGLNHHVGPATLLAYAEQLFGHRRIGWILPVPAVDLDHGEGLSASTTAFVDAVLMQAGEIWTQISNSFDEIIP